MSRVFLAKPVKCVITLSIVLAHWSGLRGDSESSTPRVDLTWTDPDLAAAEDLDFLIQGEYGSDRVDAGHWGVQVVALGGGVFDAYLLEGGLPGAGWEKGKQRIRLRGKRDDSRVLFEGADQGLAAVIEDGKFTVRQHNKTIAQLPRVERTSPTLGKEPPKDAIVLFDGTTADAWINGVVEDGLLVNNNVSTRELFGDYRLHLEFRTPYKPYARKQQRGNSGVYHQGRYETQVLDSFGLEGKANECGGIYSIAPPLVNACLPPLTWQTYDVDFVQAKFDTQDQLLEPAHMTVHLNGIVIHHNQRLPKTTTASPIRTVSPEPGPIFLQHHKNPVYYRNIWLVPQ